MPKRIRFIEEGGLFYCFDYSCCAGKVAEGEDQTEGDFCAAVDLEVYYYGYGECGEEEVCCAVYGANRSVSLQMECDRVRMTDLFVRPMAEKVLLEKQCDVFRMENVQAAFMGQHWNISVPLQASRKQMRNTG